MTHERAKKFQLSGKGEVYSYTKLEREHTPDDFQDKAPYILAFIKLDEGIIRTAQLTDLDANQSIEIGMRVEMVIRRLCEEGEQGIIIYGYKFRSEVETE